MPRHPLLAVVFLACMVGLVWRPLAADHERRVPVSLNAPALLAASPSVPTVRVKSAPDLGGTMGLGVARLTAAPVSAAHRVWATVEVPAPPGAESFRLPPRAPPAS